MKNSTKWILRLFLIIGGAAAGFFLSATIGCSKTCLILGTPWIACIYMGILGLLLSYIIFPGKKEP